MKILLIEDNKEKASVITAYLLKQNVLKKNIIVAENMTDFAASLKEDIGLFIIDFYLPSVNQGAPALNAKAILETIGKADKNDALLLAISSYPDEFKDVRAYYEAHGCILADYKDKNGWQSTLDHLLVQLKKTIKFDFLIFCALEEERNPYIVLTNDGISVSRGGIDCYDFTINGKHGSVVLLPSMGLVNAAVTAGVCIDRFKPSVVAMSGICGGFPKRTELGQLVVSSMAYEYQSGKWSTDGFLQEPYQVATDHLTLIDLKTLVANSGLIDELEKGFKGGKRPQENSTPKVGIFTSGSAVIADAKYLTQIESIHRKVDALDMEVFALHRAAQLSSTNPPCICAKTVVDLCGKKKNDDIHIYGSYISAKFMLKALADFFVKGKAH